MAACPAAVAAASASLGTGVSFGGCSKKVYWRQVSGCSSLCSSLAGMKLVAVAPPVHNGGGSSVGFVRGALYSDAKYDLTDYKFEPIKESIVAREMTRR
jgi:hypothetical protein